MSEHVAQVAIVGMAGRFPGAASVAELWDNLCRGVEAIERFDPPDSAGGDHWVGAEGTLADVDRFDAEFFGYSPREAELIDPQHRLALETAWLALESAGHAPGVGDRSVGVYLSVSPSSYLVRNLLPNAQLVGLVGGFPILIHNDKDFAATTIAHKLDLTGPAFAIGSACSSSLVAVHVACQALIAGECDMALAGGSSVQVPQRQGYVYQEEGIYSPDGRCRAFDAHARGTVGGSGVAMVVLKRLDDALADGDDVVATVLATAVNNDGGAKVGYTAPSATGQTAVVLEALSLAGVAADSIGYVEAHGTGTALGDPIEVEALTSAFRHTTDATGYCALGSVKTNLGHLDAAAGVTGLIKAALAVRHGRIPPSLHYTRPNPAIDLASSPFYVSSELRDWSAVHGPRRAGVSSFGIGGTNAHVVLEQPSEPPPPSASSRRCQLLVVSARSQAALAAATSALAHDASQRPDTALAEVAFTLGAGRRHFSHRRALVARDAAGARAALLAAGAAPAHVHDGRERGVVFAFPGQGSQHERMAAELYREEPAFRAAIDRCADVLADEGVDLVGAIYDERSARALDATAIAQPALFAVEWALAETLRHLGVEPVAAIGHSFGEYAAATVAGVLDVEAALRLVASRGRLAQALAPGAMTAVACSADDLRAAAGDGVAIAAVNGPAQSVASGAPEAIDRLERELAEAGVLTRRLRISHAFHSPLIEPMIELFAAAVADASPRPPRIPLASNLTGTWADGTDIAAPAYWTRQLRETVRFDDCLRAAFALDDVVLLEVGPGTALTTLATRHPARGSRLAVACLPHPKEDASDAERLTAALGRLWEVGVPLDWRALHGGRPRRVALPGYQFDRCRFWVDPPAASIPAPPRLPDPASLRRRARDAFGAATVADLDALGARPALEELCAALLHRHLASAIVPSERLTRAEALRALAILPAYERFLDFALRVLVEDGLASADGDGFVLAPAPADPEALAGDLRRRMPAVRGLVDLLVHCADAYPRALTTPGAALAALYPNGTGELLERTLGRDTVEHTSTGAAVELLSGVVAELSPADRPMRILEVGAGGGRLTWALMEALAGRSVEYWATDIGRLFVERVRSQAEARGVDWVRTATLDIAADVRAQGFQPGWFDLVVGLDVVHATPDVRASLRNVRSLLRPGGVLGLVETVREDRWLPMIWGLSEEWWAFTDSARSDSPLLPADRWGEVVEAAGFDGPTVLTGGPGEDAAVILAEGGERGAQTRESGIDLDELPPREPDRSRWLYVPSWRRAPLPLQPPEMPQCVAFVHREGISTRLADRLERAGLDVVRVAPAGAAAGDGSARWLEIDPVRDGDYDALLAALEDRGHAPRLIVHAWSTGRGAATLDDLDRVQDLGLHSALALARALGRRSGDAASRLVLVSEGVHEVVGGDVSRPDRAPLLGAAKVIPREYPTVTGTSVDFALPERGGPAEDHMLDLLVREATSPSDDAIVAYRGHYRWVPGFERMEARPAPRAGGRLRSGGVYLITGGLGGIGMAIADELSTLPAKVVLTGRSGLPPRGEWPTLRERDPSAAEQVRRVLAMEERGAEVLVLAADVSERGDMERVLAAAIDRFGRLDGVVHAAGVADEAGVIQRRTRAETDRALRAKLHGAFVLDRVLGDRRLDFFAVFSSIGSILYRLKFGEVGYVAGNDFLTAFAHERAARCGDGVAISWTDWREAGMWATAQRRLTSRYRAASGSHGSFLDYDLLQGISNDEGTDVFRRALAAGVPHVVVSTQDLTRLLGVHDRLTTGAHQAFLDEIELGRPAADATARARGLGGPPRTPLESTIAAMWAELLGAEAIGVRDSFFALGGDSLLALRFLARLRDEVGVDYSIARMFELPELSALAADVNRLQGTGELPPEHDEVVI